MLYWRSLYAKVLVPNSDFSLSRVHCKFKFQIFRSNGKKYCWKKDNELLNDKYMKSIIKFGEESIFIWEYLIYLGVGYLT